MLLQWISTLCFISFASTAVIDAEPSETISVIEQSPAVVSSDIRAFEGNESVPFFQKMFDLPLRMIRSALSQRSEDFDSHASAADSDSSAPFGDSSHPDDDSSADSGYWFGANLTTHFFK